MTVISQMTCIREWANGRGGVGSGRGWAVVLGSIICLPPWSIRYYKLRMVFGIPWYLIKQVDKPLSSVNGKPQKSVNA